MPTGVAICAIAKNESLYLEEWIAFHYLQGIRSILLYDNGSNDTSALIYELYSDIMDITIIKWTPSEDSFNEIQKNAYLDGARRLSNKVNFVAFIDIDEFLYSSDGNSLENTLTRFPDEVGAIAVTQRAFGSSGKKFFSTDLVTNRFQHCANLQNSESHWFKTVAKPKLIQEFDSVHSVILKSGYYILCDGKNFSRPFPHPGFSNRSADGIIRLNHYILKSEQEFLWKKSRWLGSDLENRYDNKYFFERDNYCNERLDKNLSKNTAKIISIIKQVRAGKKKNKASFFHKIFCQK